MVTQFKEKGEKNEHVSSLSPPVDPGKLAMHALEESSIIGG